MSIHDDKEQARHFAIENYADWQRRLNRRERNRAVIFCLLCGLAAALAGGLWDLLKGLI